MFKIINAHNEFLASTKKLSNFVPEGKRCKSWKKREAAEKIIAKLEFGGMLGCSIVEDDSPAKPKKVSSKPQKAKKNDFVDDPKEEILDENILFNEGFADKCTRCTKSCKQPKACEVVKCPDFEKIK